jgi:hypothetical protein
MLDLLLVTLPLWALAALIECHPAGATVAPMVER